MTKTETERERERERQRQRDRQAHTHRESESARERERKREKEREREIVRASSRTPVPTRAPCAFIPNVVLLTVIASKQTRAAVAVIA